MKLWLRAPIEEEDNDGRRRMGGGNGNKDLVERCLRSRALSVDLIVIGTWSQGEK
jgi:hypothetical protein